MAFGWIWPLSLVWWFLIYSIIQFFSNLQTPHLSIEQMIMRPYFHWVICIFFFYYYYYVPLFSKLPIQVCITYHIIFLTNMLISAYIIVVFFVDVTELLGCKAIEPRMKLHVLPSPPQTLTRDLGKRFGLFLSFFILSKILYKDNYF